MAMIPDPSPVQRRGGVLLQDFDEGGGVLLTPALVDGGLQALARSGVAGHGRVQVLGPGKDSKVVKNRHRERRRIWQVAWLIASNLPCAFVTWAVMKSWRPACSVTRPSTSTYASFGVTGRM